MLNIYLLIDKYANPSHSTLINQLLDHSFFLVKYLIRVLNNSITRMAEGIVAGRLSVHQAYKQLMLDSVDKKRKNLCWTVLIKMVKYSFKVKKFPHFCYGRE